MARVRADNARLQKAVLGGRMQSDTSLTRLDLATIAAMVPAPRQACFPCSSISNGTAGLQYTTWMHCLANPAVEAHQKQDLDQLSCVSTLQPL